MLHILKIFMVLSIVFAATGCKSGGENTDDGTTKTPQERYDDDTTQDSQERYDDDTTQDPQEYYDDNTTYKAKALLGRLANAKVDLFVLDENATLRLLSTVYTSNGDTLDAVGNFPIEKDLIEEDRFYVIRVSGGEDRDANNDGVLDDTPTPNKGEIHAIASGHTIAIAQYLHVSYASELLYQMVKKYFGRSDLKTFIREYARLVVKNIIGDALIWNTDVLAFDPVRDSDKLNDFYASKYPKIIQAIRQGNLDSQEGIYPEVASIIVDDFVADVEMIGKSKQVAVLTDKSILITDIRDPKKPKIIQTIPLEEEANGYDVAYFFRLGTGSTRFQEYLVVAKGYSGLEIFDITSRTNYKSIVKIEFQNYYQLRIDRVIVSKNTNKLFVLDGYSGLYVYDITNISSPILILSLPLGWVDSMALSEEAGKLYITGEGDKMYIINLSDIDLYHSNNTYEEYVPPPPVYAVLDINGYTGALYRRFDADKQTENIYMINVNGLEFMEFQSEDNYRIYGGYGLFQDIYDSFTRATFADDENVLYVTNNYNGLLKINIADPENFQLVSKIDVPFGGVAPLLINGEKQALVGNGYGLFVMDLEHR